MDNLKQDITIYHKNDKQWVKYNAIASVRNTYIKNRDNTGSKDVNSAIIRIFDIDNTDYEVTNGDVIVIEKVNDVIKSAPLTELRAIYGKNKVFSVDRVESNRYDDEDIAELNHIKIGAI